MSQLPDALVGQVEYHGTWDGSTNTPTLPETPEKKGEYYVTSVAGTFAGLEFEVGDWIISDGVKWDKVDNTDAVMSVNGQIGAVELTKEDLDLGLVDNTADADKPVSTPQQEALDLKADISFVEEQIAGIDAGVVTVVGTGAVKVDATDAANPVVSVDEATAEAAGLMSAADKAKLDGFDPESIIGAVESVNGQTGVVVITKADVELGLVDNFATADATVAAAGESADTFVTPLGVRQFIEAMGFVQDESGDWSADQGEL